MERILQCKSLQILQIRLNCGQVHLYFPLKLRWRVLAPPRFRMPDKPARNILCLGVRALAWPALVSRRNIQILAHLY